MPHIAVKRVVGVEIGLLLALALENRLKEGVS
jgi:hypothetical protein